MTLPDTGPERPGGLASDTRQMAEVDKIEVTDEGSGGPHGSVVIVVAVLVIAAVALVLLLR
jgi:hypothetical protein